MSNRNVPDVTHVTMEGRMTRQMRVHTTPFLLLVVVLIAIVVPAVGSAQSGSDKAVAHIDLLQFGSTQQWDVTARSNFNGTQPTGSWRMTNANADPNLTISGEITCLRVVQNVATAGGLVNDVRGGVAFFNAVLFAMVDSGKFGTTPDLFGSQFLTLPPGQVPDCTGLPPFTQQVFDGEVIVQDAN